MLVNRDRLARQLIHDEGLKLKPYRCTAGKLSIGVGRNLDDRGITEPEALGLLENDIDFFSGQCRKAIPFFASLDDVRQEVLVNMAFNMGLATLLTFKNTLALIASGKYEEAADAMLHSKWATQVGDRAKRLADMMREGSKT